MRSKLLMIVATLALSSCATAFMGSPHVEGGRAGCVAKCSGQGMGLAGMVYMGEYSSACVCQMPGAGQASLLGPAGAAAGAAVAVAVETQRRQQQQQQMQMQRAY